LRQISLPGQVVEHSLAAQILVCGSQMSFAGQSLGSVQEMLPPVLLLEAAVLDAVLETLDDACELEATLLEALLDETALEALLDETELEALLAEAEWLDELLELAEVEPPAPPAPPAPPTPVLLLEGPLVLDVEPPEPTGPANVPPPPPAFGLVPPFPPFDDRFDVEPPAPPPPASVGVSLPPQPPNAIPSAIAPANEQPPTSRATAAFLTEYLFRKVKRRS
jgi:hypothetical protein